MITARIADKALVIDILWNCFVPITFPNSMNFVVKQDQKRARRFRYLMEYQFDMAMKFGEVFMSDDKQSCVLILYPEKKKIALQSILWDIRLATYCIGYKNIRRVLKRELELKKMHPKIPFIHFWLMGTRPEAQRQGIGSTLLKEILEKYRSYQKPVYLETTTKENLEFYTKHGFTVLQETSKLNYPLYSLKY